MPTPVENEWEDKPEPLAGLIKGMLESNSPQDMLQYRRHFYAMVTGVDMAIGRIMDALKRENVLDDTLIVFSSDHGDMCGDHGMRSKHTSYYDELLRVPCVMYWPNGFGKSGRRIRGMMEMVDLLPTMLGLCGATVPQVMAGRSYAEALLSGETPKMREDIISTYAPDWTVLRSKEYKYICYNSLNTEVLYDLKNDPGETKNIAKNEQAKEAINEMRYRMLKRSLEASRSPLPRNNRY